MKAFYHLILFVITWHVLSPCICHPTLGPNRVNNTQCINREMEALLHFKHGITNDYCGLLTSWGTHTDCCQWRGVFCSNLTGHVVKLRLVGNDFDSCLEGKVSPFLGELTHLKHLNLSNNAFNGEIPHHLGNLSKLATLDLGYSYQEVEMKSLMWISRLNLLRYLDLTGTNFTLVSNWMTIVSNLNSLNVLRMEACQLSPAIPSSLTYVNSSTTLRVISLSLNFFNDSSIFRWLFDLPSISTQLVYLDLSWNQFDSPVPSEFGKLHSLSYLDLSGNGFEGSVSNIISELCNLEQLHLGGNNFNDKLSDVIQFLVSCGNHKLITLLDLRENSFWGTTPNSISSFSSLRELYLGANNLTGNLIQGIGQLTKLEMLDVSSNYLEGTLTHAHFDKLLRLRKLDLSDNLRLVINMAADWIPPFQLEVIRLRSCELGPKFPKWLQMQTNFSYFDVSNTGISDSILVNFWNSLSSNLNYLNLSYNQFYGILPNLPDGLQISIIDLSSNLFEGVVSAGFTKTQLLHLNDNRLSNCSSILCPNTTSNLLSVDLSNNLLSNELPDCWMNFHQLTSLHLENNRFYGNIPKSIGTLSTLKYLHLYNNSFSGSFPTVFGNCTSLMILNLGYNLLTGYIPPSIGNSSQNLGALILRKNHFIGEIPPSVCHLINLQILDLANNQISGVIPNCIGNFTAMVGITNQGLNFNGEEIIHKGILYNGEVETAIVSWKGGERRYKETVRFVKYIDLSSNKLSGKIPNGISILNGLRSLDLSKNNLSGNIPLEIGNLTVLEVLNLSNNHLTGEIPVSLAKVSTLDVADVSNNNLSGEIPISTQLQSFDASSYVGNPRLCGAPLPSCSKDQAPSNSNVPTRDNTNIQDKDDDFGFFLGLYISVVLGLITGFWGVCGTFIIKTSWRHAYFRFLDNIKDKVFGNC